MFQFALKWFISDKDRQCVVNSDCLEFIYKNLKSFYAYFIYGLHEEAIKSSLSNIRTLIGFHYGILLKYTRFPGLPLNYTIGNPSHTIDLLNTPTHHEPICTKARYPLIRVTFEERQLLHYLLSPRSAKQLAKPQKKLFLSGQSTKHYKAFSSPPPHSAQWSNERLQKKKGKKNNIEKNSFFLSGLPLTPSTPSQQTIH